MKRLRRLDHRFAGTADSVHLVPGYHSLDVGLHVRVFGIAVEDLDLPEPS
jgi:hypothetical protein